MAYSRLKPSNMIKYCVYALFLGLTASVCAEALRGKDIGLLTPDEIEENLQVIAHRGCMRCDPVRCSDA